ncbi:hypothetical protein ASG43_00050 [Aureimonas sp. Leaf454]|uniref:hypothetical protein n=1 Tax=Aureimonas sp. Leaf454 TaxID=1736381 RepID=UPI0006FDE947|nr:hypothetical protein [Aureimonas sp. Leaf454]KQT54073.1 hypothetical protein ASG43_00050 [Aureimonas sp. Leaf454]
MHPAQRISPEFIVRPTWKPIEKEIVVQAQGTPIVLRTALKPHSNIGKTFEDMENSGVVCDVAQEFKHGTNVVSHGGSSADRARMRGNGGASDLGAPPT